MVRAVEQFYISRGANSRVMLEEQPSREQLLLEIERLRQQVEDLKEEKADLEILLETTAEHSDTLETELRGRALEAVREGENKLAQFLEAIPIGVAVPRFSRPTLLRQSRRTAVIRSRGFTVK